MKKIKALYVGMAIVAAAASLTSCQAEMDTPALEEPKATMEANTTILDFKNAFVDQTVPCPMKDEASQTPYIIKGRVVSSDATGNIYKSIVLQDETAAIALSINQSSTYTDYRVGQEVVLNATGLYMGYYNGLQQIGWLGEYKGSPAVTFMPWNIFLAHSEKNGFPNEDVKYVNQNEAWPAENPYCIVTTFSQIPSTGEDLRKMQSQLVEFRNVHFKEGGVLTYAPYQESVNRTLVDANGGELIVRTSGYSNFYNEMIPEGTGTVRGILSYYGDSWQLLLRSLEDVMITQKGQKDDPYTVAEAIEGQNEGMAGWVKAYIVGSVKAGVNTVTSNNDVIFGSNAQIDNNILIAASDDVTDWTQCLAVELPQGSAFRASVNLLDNPGVYKKPILVNGSLSTFLGMPGLTGNGGTANDVEVEGVTISGGSTPAPGDDAIPQGVGTQESPYNVVQITSQSAAKADVWAEGYIVGYCSGSNWDTAVFGNEAPAEASTNWTDGTNVIISMLPPGQANKSNSCAAGLYKASGIREFVAISKNASSYGARIKLHGEIAFYFGQYSMKNCDKYEFVSEGGGVTPEPPVTGSTIYEGLVSNADDWDLNNAQAPNGIKVWQWDSKNVCFKGSAYANSIPNAADVTSISPVFSIPAGGAQLDFQYVFNQYKKNNEMISVADFSGYAYVMIRETGASTWTTLAEMKAQGFAWSPWYDAKYSLNNYSGKNIQIGFRYVSTAEVAGTWEIKNFKITGAN